MVRRESIPNSLFPILGSHVPTVGGIASALDRGVAIGCTAIQIFVKNNMQWFAKPLPDTEAMAFTGHPLRHRLAAVIAHRLLMNCGVASSLELTRLSCTPAPILAQVLTQA